MLKLFGGGKPDHPMGDPREARRILEAIPANDAFKALEELTHWIESVSTVEGFKPEHRAQTVLLLDDTAQPHIRKLQRDYLATPRLSKFQEHRTWSAVHGFLKQAGLAFSRCIEAVANAPKNPELPLLSVRALRSLGGQMKWQYMRYGPFDNSIWGLVGKTYALAESRRFAQVKVQVHPGVPGESSAEHEFLRAVMLSGASPDSLLPAEIDLVERLIAHVSASATLSLEQQPDIAYWIDLAKGEAPLRLARPPQHAPTLRFMAAGKANRELEQLIQTIGTTKNVPSALGLGASHEPEDVLDALRHLALYWSPKPPARKAPRHQVKSRLTVSHGLDGVFAVLIPGASLDFDQSGAESWIIENVSTGGFGAGVPQIKGEWLQIGCLLALQPEGGNNWVLGLIRRFIRETPQKGIVGIQTLARNPIAINARVPDTSDEIPVVLLDPSDESPEAQCLIRNGVLLPGQNLELERDGKVYLLLPAGVAEHGEDYEVVRFKQMIRDTS